MQKCMQYFAIVCKMLRYFAIICNMYWRFDIIFNILDSVSQIWAETSGLRNPSIVRQTRRGRVKTAIVNVIWFQDSIVWLHDWLMSDLGVYWKWKWKWNSGLIWKCMKINGKEWKREDGIEIAEEIHTLIDWCPIWVCIENENENGNEIMTWYENVWN